MARKSEEVTEEVDDETSEKVSKTPILIIPLTRQEYPRVEAYIDGSGTTVHLKALNDKGDVVSRETKYCGTAPSSIVYLADKMILTANMGRYLRDDYNANMKEFTELLREHHEFMKSIYLEGI
jgi:hypothetical protein